jgi:outer membrane protein assembly factor BamB
VLVDSDGDIVYVSPFDGTIQATVETGMPISQSPIVANNTLFILHDNGELTAWR